MLKRILSITCLLLLLSGVSFAAAPDNFFATCLTGGTTGCLDAIDVTNDGIDNGDGAYVKVTTAVYLFNYNSTSGVAESSPDTIQPDNDGGVAYSGNGRWEIVDIFLATANIDNVQVKTASGDLIIKNQAGSTIATFEDGQTAKLLNGASLNEFSTDGTFAGNSDSAVPTEKAVVTYLSYARVGFVDRSKYAWKDGDEIYIDPGVYHHDGTTDQLVYWNSQITFVLQSAGSNALSDDYGADGWHYIYLDDSAIVTQAAQLLDADCFLNETTAPTYSVTKHGWYNGNDRAIFAVYETGGVILEYYHEDDLVVFGDRIVSLAVTDIDTAWTDVTLRLPGFTTKGFVTVGGSYGDGQGNSLWRTNGQTATNGHMVANVVAGATSEYSVTPVITDSSQIIEVKNTLSNSSTITVFTDGWYFPIGM